MNSFSEGRTVAPLVTICLPTFNSIRFLRERLSSIQTQVFKDWELLVADSFSEDGTWNELIEFAERDPRVRLTQIPREGIYPAFNFLVEKAQGRYVYIATSDDTMQPDCLYKMVAVLEKFMECDICHTPLEFIDENGRTLDSQRWFGLPVASYLGRFAQVPHLRQAPFDGVMHLALNTVYTSITQILIRTRLFKRIGVFKTNWGPRGDFEWGMRAGLLSNVVYLPEKLATWRIHENQASQQAYTSEHMTAAVEMVESALRQFSKKDCSFLIPIKAATEFYRSLRISIELDHERHFLSKIKRTAYCFWRDPEVTLKYLVKRFAFYKFEKFPEAAWLDKKLKTYKISRPIELVAHSSDVT